LDTERYLKLYRFMLTARRLDELEASLAQQGEIPFYVASSGHEANAALALHLTACDWLHCHYRDKAMALARGLTPEDSLYILLGKEQSSAMGRRMPWFISQPALHLLSSCTLIGNNALQSVGVAHVVKDLEGHPIVLCSMGDGGTQEGETLEAIAEAVRSRLPVLFFIQNNRFALSTPTAGKTFYSLPSGDAEEFYGLPICRLDGTQPVVVDETLGKVVAEMRQSRGPRLVLMQVERLASHTNSDDQTVYRSSEEIEKVKSWADPVRNLRRALVEAGVAAAKLESIEQKVSEVVREALRAARAAREPHGGASAKKPLPERLLDRSFEYRGDESKPALTMLEAMRAVLRLHLEHDPKVGMYGQDIEDPKGDVFGLTRGLGRDFPSQVRNAPLSESTIVGVSIGRALAGERPVACLQFADFIGLAYNQISTELGTMYWRTGGAWSAPVIVMAVCGAYRPGLGPFHAQTPSGLTAHTPGLDVFLPSNAADAAGLLNAAFASGRPSMFLYPKSLLNDRTRMTSDDVARHLVPIGQARVCREGRDLTLVSWGSTMPLCEKVAKALEDVGLSAEVIDLRTLSPWDRETVTASAQKTGRLLVVDEDYHTCGMSGEVLATVMEAAKEAVVGARVALADTFIPYHFGAQLETLPSFRSVLAKAADMLDLDLSWEEPVKEEAGYLVVNAIGSSPSDETVIISALHVEAGQSIEEGALIASVEADKATMEISSPVTGQVEEVRLKEGDAVPVGTPLVRIKSASAAAPRLIRHEDRGRPVLQKRASRTRPAPAAPAVARSGAQTVTLSSICSALGSRCVDNAELIKKCPGWSSAEITQRTGVVTRHWIGEGESALSLAVDACRKLLARESLDLSQIDAIVCSTGTPPSTTPSLACRILKELSPDKAEVEMQAHDINAACSGYLYALQQVYDMIQSQPDLKVMLVTTETLSPVLNREDPGTYFLFGDAATASLVCAGERDGNIGAEVRRPVLSALGEEAGRLYVPSIQSREFVQMDGQKVFKFAVRKMIHILEQACAQEGMTVDDLDLIVPHQANERIIDAIRKAIKFPTEKVCYRIRDYGNTSSNTIPLSLEALLPERTKGERVGLTAFGGGYTFAAGILQVR